MFSETITSKKKTSGQTTVGRGGTYAKRSKRQNSDTACTGRDRVSTHVFVFRFGIGAQMLIRRQYYYYYTCAPAVIASYCRVSARGKTTHRDSECRRNNIRIKPITIRLSIARAPVVPSPRLFRLEDKAVKTTA